MREIQKLDVVYRQGIPPVGSSRRKNKVFEAAMGLTYIVKRAAPSSRKSITLEEE